MREEKILFQNNKRQTLVGILHVPAGASEKNKVPGIAIVHGFGGSKEDFNIIDWCNHLALHGVAALRFDLSGSGESQGNFEDSLFSQWVNDAKIALFQLESFKEIDKTRLGIAGFSLGGSVALIAGAEDKRVKAVAGLSPALEFNPLDVLVKRRLVRARTENRIEMQGFLLKKQFFEDRMDYTPMQAVEKLGKPLLLLVGANDVIVEPETVKKAFERAKQPKLLELIQGADHLYLLHNKEVAQKLLEFMSRYLK